MEDKKLIKICSNKLCGAYGIRKELEHSKDAKSYGDVHCRFCGHTNYIREK